MDEKDKDHDWAGLDRIILDEGVGIWCCSNCCEKIEENPTASFEELRSLVGAPLEEEPRSKSAGGGGAAEEKAGGSSVPLCKGWEEYSDDEGVMYYHCPDTDETTYNHPGYADGEGSAQMIRAGGGECIAESSLGELKGRPHAGCCTWHTG